MSRREINIYVSGFCTATVILLVYLFFTNNLPFMQAAGVGTGAPDINAKYLDGYGTATTSTSSKVYISDASGYLPDSSVDTGAIVNGTIDVANDIDLTTDGAGSGLDADLLDGSHKTSFMPGSNCEYIYDDSDVTYSGNATATATCSSGKYIIAGASDTCTDNYPDESCSCRISQSGLGEMPYDELSSIGNNSLTEVYTSGADLYRACVGIICCGF